MICVSIAQQSHRFALVDMINAAGQCDLIEVRLDRFEKPPEIKPLLEASRKPVIIACRRLADGGDWTGAEAGRLALLRQAVLEKAPYVEIELDVADQIRRFGETKRVISYTNLQEVPSDLDAIYDAARSKDPDVIKLTLPARTPEEAFPILRLVAKGQLPTVAVGLGRNGLMLNILGRRYKAPWTFAALEKGMEAYPGMATIGDLRGVYGYDDIDSKTPLLAICGAPAEQALTARILNHGFRLAGDRTRCLPVEVGDVALFKKVADALKLSGVLVDPAHQASLIELCEERDEAATFAGGADFLARSGERWKAFTATARAIVRRIEAEIAAHPEDERPLNQRAILVVGASSMGAAVASLIAKRGMRVIVADKENEQAQKLAGPLSARYVPAGHVYTTICDGIVVCPGRTGRANEPPIELPRSIARPGMIGVDLTASSSIPPWLDELRLLRGAAVSPIDLLLERLSIVLKAFTGKSLATETLREPLAELDIDAIWPRS